MTVSEVRSSDQVLGHPPDRIHYPDHLDRGSVLFRLKERIGSGLTGGGELQEPYPPMRLAGAVLAHGAR
jgi:hypothetical protein